MYKFSPVNQLHIKIDTNVNVSAKIRYKLQNDLENKIRNGIYFYLIAKIQDRKKILRIWLLPKNICVQIVFHKAASFIGTFILSISFQHAHNHWQQIPGEKGDYHNADQVHYKSGFEHIF